MSESTWNNRITGYGTEAPDQLVANPRNWRVHPTNQQQALKGSLTELGWIQNVIVNQRTGFVLDGHARVALALRHNQPDIPVTYVDLSEDEEALALATLDPISAMAGADKDQLEALLADINTQDEGLLDLVAGLSKEYGIGFGSGGLTDPDDVPSPLAESITKPGDLWLLGEHRLLCGDARVESELDQVLDGHAPQMLLTDPPYGMDLDTDFSGIVGALGRLSRAHGTRGNTYRRVIGDDEDFDPAPLMTRFASVKEQFWFGGDYYAERIPNRGTGSWLVWDKRKESQADAVGSGFELIWTKQRHKRRILRHDWFGFLSSANGPDARNRLHPTQKPVTLLVDILKQWGDWGDLVLDCYGGSGSTLIACEQTGRRCAMLEIDPTYCDVIIRRWENFTGQTANRERIEGAA